MRLTADEWNQLVELWTTMEEVTGSNCHDFKYANGAELLPLSLYLQLVTLSGRPTWIRTINCGLHLTTLVIIMQNNPYTICR